MPDHNPEMKSGTGDKKPTDLKTFLLSNIKALKADMDKLTEDRIQALSFYRSDPSIVEQAPNRSKATTTDLLDVVEWAKPALLEVFASGDEACSMSPQTEEDTEAVNNLDLLVNHQLKVQNNWFMVLHDWLDDCLKLKTGWIKYQWFKKVEEFDKEYLGLTEDEYQVKLTEKNATITNTVSRPVAGPPAMPPPEAPGMAMMPPVVP